jgi:hypothetical protein
MRAACLALLGAIASAPVQGQAVYRCGQSYSHESCPQGRAIDVQDTRTEAQRAESTASRERQGMMADQLAEQRMREAAASPRGVAGINGHRTSADPEQEKPKAKKRKSRDDENYTAAVPGSQKRKKQR